VKNGVPGCTGDAASYNSSDLDNHLLAHQHRLYQVSVLKDGEGGSANILPYVLPTVHFGFPGIHRSVMTPPFSEVAAAIEYNKAVTSVQRCAIATLSLQPHGGGAPVLSSLTFCESNLVNRKLDTGTQTKSHGRIATGSWSALSGD
jgi:hypothetical protein